MNSGIMNTRIDLKSKMHICFQELTKYQ